MELHRHPCGFFYSREFADFLRQKQEEEGPAHSGELLTLGYIRCREGVQAGAAWWQLDWVPLLSTPAAHHFHIGETPVAIQRQTQRGLMNRLLHYADGQVLVKQ